MAFQQGYSRLAFIQTALLLETEYNWSDVVGINNWVVNYEYRQSLPGSKQL